MSYSNLQEQLQLFIKTKLYQNDYNESNHFSEDFIDTHLNRYYYHLAIILRNANDKTDNNLLILLANIKYYIDFILIQTIINCYILYYDDIDVNISTLIINYFNIIKINPNLSNKVMRVYGLLYNAIVINKLKLNFYTKDNYKDFDIDKLNKSDLKDLEEKAKLTDDYIQEFKKDYDDFLKLKKNKDELTIKRLDEIAKNSLKNAAELIFKLFDNFQEKINRYFNYLKIEFNSAYIDQNYMDVNFDQEEMDRQDLKGQINKIENFKKELINKYHIHYSDENKIETETITQEDIIKKLNDIKNNYSNPNELKKMSDIKNYRFTTKDNDDEEIKVILDLILKLNKTFKFNVIDNKEDFDIQLKTLGFILDKLIEINDNIRNNNVIFYFTGKNIDINKQQDDDELLSNIILSKLFNDLKNKNIDHIIINLLLDIIFKVYNSKYNTINFDDIMKKLFEYLQHKREEFNFFNGLYQIQYESNYSGMFINEKNTKLLEKYEYWKNRSKLTYNNIIIIHDYIDNFLKLLNDMIADRTLINKNIRIALDINILIQYILFILNQNVISKKTIPITNKDELRKLFNIEHNIEIRGGGNGNINYLNILRIKTLNLIFKENLDNLKEFSNEIYSDQYRNENLILDEYN